MRKPAGRCWCGGIPRSSRRVRIAVRQQGPDDILGWASTLLFGRVPASRQILLLGITFGSVIWLVMLAGLIVPDVGAFLLLLIPPQDVVPETTIRLPMLAGVLIVPGLVGVLTLALTQGAQRTARGTPQVRRPRLPADRPPRGPAHLPRALAIAQGHQPGQTLDRRPRPDGGQPGRL